MKRLGTGRLIAVGVPYLAQPYGMPSLHHRKTENAKLKIGSAVRNRKISLPEIDGIDMAQNPIEARYVRERNKAVLIGVDALRAFAEKWHAPFPKDPHAADITLHKLRVAINATPETMREASRRWLQEHGYREEIGANANSPGN